MNAHDLIAHARIAMFDEFVAEAIRRGATVHADGGSLVAVWPEAGRQTTSATLSTENGRLILTETATIRVPDGLPDELLQRFGHRAKKVGDLRRHLGMVQWKAGVPLLAPSDELKVVRA